MPLNHDWIPSAYCPMGCGATVHRSHANGNLVCLNPACPRPHAPIEVLGDAESEHLVRFTGDGAFYHLRHPLRERLDDALLTCQAAYDLVELLDAGLDVDESVVYRLTTTDAGPVLEPRR